MVRYSWSHETRANTCLCLVRFNPCGKKGIQLGSSSLSYAEHSKEPKRHHYRQLVCTLLLRVLAKSKLSSVFWGRMSKEMDEAGTGKHPKSFRDFAVLPAGAPKWTAPFPTFRAVSISSRQALRTLTNSPAWIHLDIRFCPTKVPRCLVSSGEIVANTTSSSSQQPPSFTCRVLACRPSDDRSPDTLVSCDASWREVRIKCQLVTGEVTSATFPLFRWVLIPGWSLLCQ